ncbi:MAG: hypothetical protein NTX57_04370 [Armatimonadetes bacterium]|nr:hypothetical protein [Armatimonadota bacterium]
MAAYKHSPRNYLPLLFLLALGGVGLTSWGTWRSLQPTMQIPLAPRAIRSALSTSENWRLSGTQHQVYGRWQQYLNPRSRPQFSADGRYIAVGLGLSLHLYSTETGKLLAHCETPPAKPLPNTIPHSPRLRIFSVHGENAWYVWHEGQDERAQVYRLTPESWNATELLPGFISVALISPDARFVFGYGQKGARLGWDRKTGKVVKFSEKLVIFWEQARIDPRSGAVYGVSSTPRPEKSFRHRRTCKTKLWLPFA